MKKHLIAAALAALLTACGGGDPEPRASIHETVATSAYLGSSGNTHVNQVDAILIETASRVKITVEGEFVADNRSGPAGALIYSKFSPIWVVDNSGWTTGPSSPAMTEIRLAAGANAVYTQKVSASYAIYAPAGSVVAAGVYFVDHLTAQVDGRLVNARTTVKIEPGHLE